MQNLENLDVFEFFDYTKTAEMPEGPFCQVRAHMCPVKNKIHSVAQILVAYQLLRWFTSHPNVMPLLYFAMQTQVFIIVKWIYKSFYGADKFLSLSE